MGKYIKLFGEHSQYETFIGGEGDTEFIKPNVSHCIEENEVHYNPIIHDYSKDYLTFDILESGAIIWKASSEQIVGKTISYSINNGEWTDITSSINGASFDISAGDKVRFKGSNSTYCIKEGWIVYYTTFSDSTASFDIEGNIMSLLYGDDFIDKITFEGDYNFLSLFKETNVVNAYNLILPAITMSYGAYSQMFLACTSLTTAPSILPATTLTGYINSSYDGCYANMFQGCTSLTTAPELPATTLTKSCYHYMFYGCTNLNYIKAMFTTTPSTNYTNRWVNGVASSGTFIKNAAASWDVSGVNGIPEGWTVETATE